MSRASNDRRPVSTTGRVPAAAPEVEGGKGDATAVDGGVQPKVLPLVIASGLILFGPRVCSAHPALMSDNIVDPPQLSQPHSSKRGFSQPRLLEHCCAVDKVLPAPTLAVVVEPVAGPLQPFFDR